MDASIRSRLDQRSVRTISLAALALTLGLQLMRVLFPTITWYLRDTVGLSSITLAYYAFPVFLTAFLAAVLRRIAGPRLTLWITAGGLALLRVAEQIIVDPALDLWVSAAGTSALLLFLPNYLGNIRSQRGPEAAPAWAGGLLIGMALDTALKGLTATLDLSWIPGVSPILVVAGLAAILLYLVWREPAAPANGNSDLSGADALPLLAFGPYLTLQAIIFQNQGWVAEVGGLSPAAAFAVVVAGNLIAALGFTWGASRTHTLRTVLALIAGVYLVAATLTAESPATPFAITVLVSQGVMGWGWALLGAAASRPGRPGLGRLTAAYASGVLLFLIVSFAYYVSLDLALPIPRAAWLPFAAALLGLGWVLASRRIRRERGRVWLELTPALAAAVLLLAPLLSLAAGRAPRATAGQERLPITVMTYNIHSAYNRAGRQDPEAIARVIEAANADVIGLQEVSRGWLINGSTDLAAWLSRRLGMEVLFQGTSDPVWGNALLSRRPILEHGSDLLPREGTLIIRGYLWARIDAGAPEPLLVINTHLHQIAAQHEPRVRQVGAILDFWNGDPFTFVIGDLNSRPGSEEMDLLTQAGLVDTWEEAGSGPGNTFSSDNPIERIDWIWHTGDLAALSVQVPSTTASDHLPVVGTFE